MINGRLDSLNTGCALFYGLPFDLAHAFAYQLYRSIGGYREFGIWNLGCEKINSSLPIQPG